MTDTKDTKPKLLIEAESLFGGKRTEVVQVDSNELDPVSEAQKNMLAALVPTTFLDSVGDALCWLAGAAFFMSIRTHTPLLEFLSLPIYLIIITAGFGAVYAVIKIPTLFSPIALRLLLVILGTYLGSAQ